MDPISAIGPAGNILQFIEFGGQVISRLQQFCSNARDVPETFREVTNSLSILLNSLEDIKQDLENDKVNQKTEAALGSLIQDCTEQIKSLDQILKETLPAPGDKALISFWQDKKIQRIRTIISNYQGSLLLYQTRRPRTGDGVPEHQRSSTPQTVGGSGSGDSSYPDYGTMMLSADRAGEQFTPHSPGMTLISTTSSLGWPTEKIFESGWSFKPESTARTVWTSSNPVASEPKPRQSEPATVETALNDSSLMLSEPAIDPLQRTIEAEM